jgi:hypothetical protein
MRKNRFSRRRPYRLNTCPYTTVVFGHQAACILFPRESEEIALF